MIHLSIDPSPGEIASHMPCEYLSNTTGRNSKPLMRRCLGQTRRQFAFYDTESLKLDHLRSTQSQPGSRSRLLT